MAKKFLDESGVSTLWNKIKSMFVKKANLSENVNFNDVTEGGMYRYNSSITNGPDGAGSHGQLLVVRGANDTIAQLCFPYADSRMFLRTGNAVNNPNGTWQGWVAIANTNDLNNYLPLSGGQVNGVLSVYGPSSNGLIKVKSSSSYESSIGFYHWDTAKLTLGICDDINNKLGIYDTANTYGGGAKWYTLAINAPNGFNPDNFNDSNTWLNHTSTQNEVGNSNRPLVLYGTQIKNNSGQIMATEEYVNNKMPTFSFSNGVLTITTH